MAWMISMVDQDGLDDLYGWSRCLGWYLIDDNFADDAIMISKQPDQPINDEKDDNAQDDDDDNDEQGDNDDGNVQGDDIYIMVKCMSVCLYVCNVFAYSIFSHFQTLLGLKIGEKVSGNRRNNKIPWIRKVPKCL